MRGRIDTALWRPRKQPTPDNCSIIERSNNGGQSILKLIFFKKNWI